MLVTPTTPPVSSPPQILDFLDYPQSPNAYIMVGTQIQLPQPLSPSTNVVFINKLEGLLYQRDKDNDHENLAVIVKNHVLTVLIETRDIIEVNFLDCTMKAALYYAEEKRNGADMEKEVSFVNINPLEYKSHATCGGSSLVVEVKVHTLSSQHQGSHFIVAFNITNETTRRSYEVRTPPLRVVSKVDHAHSQSVITAQKKKAEKNEKLIRALQEVEISEHATTALLLQMCKMKGIELKPESLEQSPNKFDAGATVSRLCAKFRGTYHNATSFYPANYYMSRLLLNTGKKFNPSKGTAINHIVRTLPFNHAN